MMEMDEDFRGSAAVDWSGINNQFGHEESFLVMETTMKSKEANLGSVDIDNFL